MILCRVDIISTCWPSSQESRRVDTYFVNKTAHISGEELLYLALAQSYKTPEEAVCRYAVYGRIGLSRVLSGMVDQGLNTESKQVNLFNNFYAFMNIPIYDSAWYSPFNPCLSALTMTILVSAQLDRPHANA